MLSPDKESIDQRIKKYETLYESAISAFMEEKQRAFRLDEKGSRHLGIITFFLGMMGIFGKTLATNHIPPRAALDWVLIVLFGGAFLSLSTAWWKTFLVLKNSAYPTPPVSVEFFDQHHILDILRSTADRFRQRLEDVRSLADRKARYINSSYNAIAVAALLLFVFSVCFAIDQWTRSAQPTISQ